MFHEYIFDKLAEKDREIIAYTRIAIQNDKLVLGTRSNVKLVKNLATSWTTFLRRSEAF